MGVARGWAMKEKMHTVIHLEALDRLSFRTDRLEILGESEFLAQFGGWHRFDTPDYPDVTVYGKLPSFDLFAWRSPDHSAAMVCTVATISRPR